MTMATILDYYKYAYLAAASYVDLGRDIYGRYIWGQTTISFPREQPDAGAARTARREESIAGAQAGVGPGAGGVK
jgi:hypothetical protein